MDLTLIRQNKQYNYKILKYTTIKLDFWKEARRLGDHADIMISDKTASLLETQFQRRNISYTVTVSDVEK